MCVVEDVDRVTCWLTCDQNRQRKADIIVSVDFIGLMSSALISLSANF